MDSDPEPEPSQQAEQDVDAIDMEVPESDTDDGGLTQPTGKPKSKKPASAKALSAGLSEPAYRVPKRHQRRNYAHTTEDVLIRGLAKGTVERLLKKGGVVGHASGLARASQIALFSLIQSLTRRTATLVRYSKTKAPKTLSCEALRYIAPSTLGQKIY